MSSTTLQFSFLQLMFILSNCVLTYTQTVIDNSFCEKRGKHCPESHYASYKTKCCVENDGGTQLITCCNPLVGLYIGLGVSLPIILCILITLVTVYCCWTCRKRTKLRRLAESVQLQQQERNRQRLDQQLGDAPPAYTPLADEEVNTLPSYTPEDPYLTTLTNNNTHSSPTTTDNDAQPSPTESYTDESHLLLDNTQ